MTPPPAVAGQQKRSIRSDRRHYAKRRQIGQCGQTMQPSVPLVAHSLLALSPSDAPTRRRQNASAKAGRPWAGKYHRLKLQCSCSTGWSCHPKMLSISCTKRPLFWRRGILPGQKTSAFRPISLLIRRQMRARLCSGIWLQSEHAAGRVAE